MQPTGKKWKPGVNTVLQHITEQCETGIGFINTSDIACHSSSGVNAEQLKGMVEVNFFSPAHVQGIFSSGCLRFFPL